ncbi:hypothetical protein PTKIN_Ptkin11bG0044100 [Pterospermum kingtungense]
MQDLADRDATINPPDVQSSLTKHSKLDVTINCGSYDSQLERWLPTSITGITIINGYDSDREALLAIKSQINHDPLGVTSSWNNSVALCQWQGLTCGRRHQRVTKLDLSHQQLDGTLSPHVGNLSFLRFINLEDNNFYGVIPSEIGRLSRLERTTLLGISRRSFGNLLKLQILYISYNNLTGQLPASLGNISTLQVISFEENNLQGRLPATLGLVKRLVILELQVNNLSGLIPPSIFNITSLERLSLGGNQLSGNLPVSLGSNLPNIRKFVVAANNLSGTLPASVSNISNWEGFDVSRNQFSGKVSINFQNAKNLYFLNMELNNLGSGGSGGLDFITTLTNCSRLRTFSIGYNRFGGLLPNSITNFSTKLRILYPGGNQITGSITWGLTNLVNLMGIGLENNQLTGTIPDSLCMLKNLQLVNLGQNALTGRIPTAIGNLSLLNKVGLEYNQLEGSIPAEFGKCQNLMLMALDDNRLTGPVPKEIFSIVTLSVALDLSNNLLSGSFPSEVGNLKSLVELDISGNMFSGQIPYALSSSSSLCYDPIARFISIDIRAIHHISQLQSCDASGDAEIAVFARG